MAHAMLGCWRALKIPSRWLTSAVISQSIFTIAALIIYILHWRLHLSLTCTRKFNMH